LVSIDLKYKTYDKLKSLKGTQTYNDAVLGLIEQNKKFNDVLNASLELKELEKDKETEKRLRELYSNFNKRANISTDKANEVIFIYCKDQIKSKFPEFFKENEKNVL